MGWQLGKVGNCFLAYFVAFPPGFPEECDPVSVLFGDYFDVECHVATPMVWELIGALGLLQ